MHSVRFDGEKLRELRLARKWGQHELAEQARRYCTGITQASISRYENGMEPSGRNALALARALGVGVTALYRNGVDSDEPVSREAEILDALRPLARVLAGQR